ncbi:MAG: hypothetical protein LBR07_02130 [Puniceicoccales bacterium]|jgi:hypothetical protein|nr:hypothetical protein [Puniceicoccales bacterium]
MIATGHNSALTFDAEFARDGQPAPALTERHAERRRLEAARSRARRRRWTRAVLILLVLAGFVSSVFAIGQEMFGGRTAPVPAHLVSYATSNGGRLDREWFLKNIFRAGDGGTLGIRERLLAVPQVKSVTKCDQRRLDDGFDIVIEERVPVARLRSGAKTLLVAADGVAWTAHGYGGDTDLIRLPPLTDAEPRPSKRYAGAGALDVPGMPEIAAFLGRARKLDPKFFYDWESISVRDFATGDVKAAGACLRVRRVAVRAQSPAPGALPALPEVSVLYFSANPEDSFVELAYWFKRDFREWARYKIGLVRRAAADAGEPEPREFAAQMHLRDRRLSTSAKQPKWTFRLIPLKDL